MATPPPTTTEEDTDVVVFSQSPENTNKTSATLETSLPSVPAPKSFLDLVNDCDSFPHYTTNPTLYTHLTTTHYHLLTPHHIQSLGLILPSVAAVFANLPNWDLDHDLKTLTLNVPDDDGTSAFRDARTSAMAATTAAMRATRHFKVLDGWRDELYPVFGEKGEVLFEVERSASPLLGIVTYGAHMTVFTRRQAAPTAPPPTTGDSSTLDTQENNKDPNDSDIHIWVPRRSSTKQTYPSYLDNSVAGGLSTHDTPLTCLLHESSEEANLAPSLVRSLAKPAGTVSYFSIRDARAGGESGLMQPECQYVYDMEVSEDVILEPGGDGEVEAFELLRVKEVRVRLGRGEFKPNCAMVLLDFLVRRGLVTAEREPDYAQVVARLHRLLEFPTAKF